MNIPEGLPLYMGADEMPEHIDDGLTKGGIYSIRIESPPTRLSLVIHALYLNLVRGIHCTLVTRLSLEEFLAHADQKKAEFFLEAIEKRKLFVFSMLGDYAKNLFRFGPERFLYELEQFKVPNDGFIVIDHADSLFTVDDRAIAGNQARTYREWMKKNRNIALFLFLHVSANESHHGYFQSMSDHFSGLAGLYIGRDGLEVGVDFWALQRGIIMAKHLAVTTDNDGQIRMAPSLIVNRRLARRAHKDEKPHNVIDLKDGRQQYPNN